MRDVVILYANGLSQAPTGTIDPDTADRAALSRAQRDGQLLWSRDINSYREASKIAAELESITPGSAFLGFDRGPHVFPRFGVIKVPAVGVAPCCGCCS